MWVLDLLRVLLRDRIVLHCMQLLVMLLGLLSMLYLLLPQVVENNQSMLIPYLMQSCLIFS